MTYLLVKGYFYVVGYSPDGDSIKFQAKNKAHWQKIITEHREKFEENIAEDNGIITLRLQGIDALETHYSPPPLPKPKDLQGKTSRSLKKPDPGGHKQPEAFGELATDEFMRMLGITNVEWKHWGKQTWVSKAYLEKRGKAVCIEEKYEDRVPGYILTRDVEKNGRPIAWVFPGSTRERDGSSISQDKLWSRVEQSANYQLLRMGLVYPYFYMTLPGKIREKLAEAARQAQLEGINLWSRDKTTGPGVSITSLDKITDRYEIYPYLFRRVLKHWYRLNMERYWAALQDDRDDVSLEYNERVDLKGFFESGNPYVFVVSDQDFVRLDSVVEIKRNRLRMKKYPFDIVFLS